MAELLRRRIGRCQQHALMLLEETLAQPFICRERIAA
jgi:hypothetical protein